MKTLWGICLVMTLALPASAQEASKETKRFKLFADCKPMNLVVERLHPKASEIGLTRKAIQAAVESRLRSARLYSDKPALYYLYVRVSLVGNAFALRLQIKKLVFDPHFSGSPGVATTWDNSSIGTHDSSAGYILSGVSQHMDAFLVEFLRVNEAACAKRFGGGG